MIWLDKLKQRCFLCTRKHSHLESLLKEREKSVICQEEQIKLQQNVIENYTAYIAERELLFKKREELLSTQKQFNIEREMALDIRQSTLESEKERMMDSDAIEIKRKILLPALQERWKAEAKKIDADRIVIATTTPAVLHSLEARKQELKTTVANIKQRPKNTANNDLMLEAQGRFNELEQILSLIDQVKSNA